MSTNDLAARVGATLAKTRARRVGLVVGVCAGGETGFWHRGELRDGANTIFEIGSITKVFTTTLLADMVRERAVALEDPVQRHLPDGVQLPVKGREITLEDLATHRSGLPRLPKGLLRRGLNRRDPYASFDEARLAAAISATQPRHEPGVKVVYSNYGMGLLGHVLARRAGMSYEQLVRTRICEPLGLVDTRIEVAESERRRVAIGHTPRGRPTPPWHLAALAGAGGLRSTAEDLLAFLSLHMSTSGSPLAQAAADTARPRGSFGKLEIGLGWTIVPAGQRLPVRRTRFKLLIHDGGTGGFASWAAVIPEKDACVIVLGNQARPVGGLGMRVLKAVGD